MREKAFCMTSLFTVREHGKSVRNSTRHKYSLSFREYLARFLSQASQMASMCERQISAGMLCLRALGIDARIPESPTAPWLRSTRMNFPMEVRESDLGFLRSGNESHFIPPIHSQTIPPLLHPESLVAMGWNSYFNLWTQLFNPHFKRRRHPAIRSATERNTDSVSALFLI